MTIDDQGRLHALWASYSSSGRAQWYRNYDPANPMSASAIVSISAVTGP